MLTNYHFYCYVYLSLEQYIYCGRAYVHLTINELMSRATRLQRIRNGFRIPRQECFSEMAAIQASRFALLKVDDDADDDESSKKKQSNADKSQQQAAKKKNRRKKKTEQTKIDNEEVSVSSSNPCIIVLVRAA